MVVRVERVVVLPQEVAALEVARELERTGYRSVAVRKTGGESLGWDVLSSAVYPLPDGDPEPLRPFLLQERRRLAALARSRGGALLTYVWSTDGGVPASASDGPARHDAAAGMTLPVPLPIGSPRPVRAPAWPELDFGDPTAEMTEAIAVLHRMYGTSSAVPPALAHLTDDDLAQEFDEPDATRSFLADLVSTAHHLPASDGGIVSIIPFLAELARSRDLSPGARTSLLLLLLRLAAEPDTMAVGTADWTAMRGGQVVAPDPHLAVRDVVISRIPALLPRWDLESGAARCVLAGLAVFWPAQTAAFVRPRLADIPAPPGTDRADLLALAEALLAEDIGALHEALHRVATWDHDLAEQLDSPHVVPSRAARAALAAAVARDLPAALRLT